MSVTNPAHRVTRWSVVGMEGMWVKMWDPPTESPDTPDNLAPTNPVPEVMAAAGLLTNALNQPMPPSRPNTVQRALMSDLPVPTWDGQKVLNFFTISDPDINATTFTGTYPGPTTRVPRGVVFHGETQGKGPPPHTIHWHGIEPTPMNDGVGHCSMEVGSYIYQWQPNFIGTYFYHCHRNTMQHFEFGLFGLLLIEPPDAYFATLANPAIPIGHCRDGKRRIAANLSPTAANPAGFPQFPDFNGNLLTAADPWTGDPALLFGTDPHAMTVAYDVECLWVNDDRDSVWSDLASNPRATFPRHGNNPGFDDEFNRNPGDQSFFAFNDFNADYWFITGVPVPCAKFGTGTIDPAGPAPAGGGLPGGLIPPFLNSGVSGTMVAVDAHVGQTILVRCLDAAYNSTEITFPVDVVIIAWDGRALGQPPFGFNEPYLVPANTPIKTSTARRFDALIRPTTAINSFATVKFIDTRGENVAGFEQIVCTARIPFNIVQHSIGITASAGPNGIITPIGHTPFNPGESQTYTISPDPGYAVAALVVDGTQLPGATSHTFTNITTDHYINAYFEPSGIAITAAAGPNGTISPAGATGVTPGSNMTYTITPAAGFAVSALVVDGTQLPGATTHTFTNVTGNHYINAYFEASTMAITAAAGPNGTISPIGATAVTPGSDHTYTITPNPGFIVAALVVDGTQLPGAATHTFTNVTGSHYINAYFEAATPTITAAAGANGSISPTGATSLPAGSNQTYTITPNAGFVVAALVVDGTQLPGTTTHTFTNVIADHYINAYFQPAPSVTITAAAAANGTISPAGANVVQAGSTVTFTITPDPGFTVAALVVDGQLLPGATSHTFTNVNGDHYINAYFQ